MSIGSDASDSEFLGFSSDNLSESANGSSESSIFRNLEENMSEESLDKTFALKFIPEFNGDRGDFHKFVSCCDVISHNLVATDVPMLLNIIRGKLTGSAYSIIKYKTFNSWASLKKILQDQFLETRTLTQIQTELINVRQNSGEDVRSYANRVEKLLTDLNDACIASEGPDSSTIVESLNSKTALRAFVNGLHSSIRLIIKASRFGTLSEAVEAAVEEEKNVNSSKATNSVKSRPTCSYCHKTGHTASNCFLRSNNSIPKPSYLPKFDIKKEPQSSPHKIHLVICSYCKNKGHHIQECRKRQYNENKKRQAKELGNDPSSGASGGATRARNLKK